MAQSTAYKPDSTRRWVTYQDVLDALAHQVAAITDGTLHTQPRGLRRLMTTVCAVLLAGGAWLPAHGQSESSPATVAAAPEKRACETEGAVALTRTQRAQVQQGLNALKFDVGTADGIFGPRTRAGIARWQLSQAAEAATGCLDEEDVAMLIDVSKAGAPAKPTAAAVPVSAGQPEGFVTAAPKTLKCTEVTGQIVTLQAPEKVWRNLEGQQTTKSEFETSTQFAARTRETTRRASRQLAVEGTYNPDQVVYNADCQGRRHCHRGRRGEMVRGGRDEAGGGVSRKRREGVARAQFPAGGDAQVRSSSPCFARGCG